MRTKKPAAIALALSGILMIGAVSFPAAAPDKKKNAKKPAKTTAAAPSKEQIEAGKKIYLAQGCKACHLVGDDNGGKTGPALTHVAKTRKPDWLEAQIRNPKKFKPDSTMPAYGPDKINAKDMKSLVAYLSSLK